MNTEKLLHFGKIFRQVKKNATTGIIFDKASGKPVAKKIKEKTMKYLRGP